jgi:LmbE family N-acetylglucosaminyl deacetylase
MPRPVRSRHDRTSELKEAVAVVSLVKLTKGRLRRVQNLYWTYSRPLYCPTVATPTARRVLVLSPHIDDDVIGCGGVIKQHADLGAVVVSVYLRDGGETRESEARRAAAIVGVKEVIFMRWGPPAEAKSWGPVPTTKSRIPIQQDTVKALREIIDTAKPEVLYAPFFLDPHPDHASATYLLGAALTACRTPIERLYLYEVWGPLVPDILIDITKQADVKLQAINAHRSQVEDINMGLGMLSLNRYRAEMNRIRGYAEAYLRVTPQELQNMLRSADSSAP